jgi:GxxExxY protein
VSGDERTRGIIGAAMEVHRLLGPGHLEGVYQEALSIEFELREIAHETQPRINLDYKGRRLKKYYQPDFVVGEVVVEIKAQSALAKVDEAQVINALKCCEKPVGLLLNFGEASLRIRRFAR